jgi:hypothetical protein
VPVGGFSARCSRVLLIENGSGRWRPFQSFALSQTGLAGAAAAPPNEGPFSSVGE